MPREQIWFWLRSRFPCCTSYTCRFRATLYVPREVYSRLCPSCNTAWQVTREPLTVRAQFRADTLTWEQVV